MGKSAAASAAASQYDLDLPQILVFAEFDGDEEAQRRLHEALRVGNFAHVAQRLRDARAEREAKEQLIADAAAQGVAVVDNAGYGCTEQPLTRLGLGSDEAIQQHRESCVGHAVYVETTWIGTGRGWVATPVCVDPIANGHTVPDHVKRDMGVPTKPKVADMDPQDAEKARAERKMVIDNNKAWQSAVVVRRKWIAEEFAKRAKVPAGAELFIAAELLRNPFFLRDGLTEGLPMLASVMLPDSAKHPLRSSELAELLVGKIGTSKRATVLAAALIFFAWEHKHGGDDQGKNTWRRFDEHDTRILQQMETWGYTLDDVEKLVAHPKPKSTRRRARKPATQAATTGGAEAPADESPQSHPDGDDEAPAVQGADDPDDEAPADQDAAPGDAVPGQEGVEPGAAPDEVSSDADTDDTGDTDAGGIDTADDGQQPDAAAGQFGEAGDFV